MNNGIYSATAGMLTSVERLNTISNNLANVDSNGYKTEIPFERVIKFLAEGPYPGKDQPILAGTALNMENGVIKLTGRKLDMAFEGPGFFEVEGPNGERFYTRNGAFNLNSERQLVTADGFKVLDTFNREITIFGDSYYFTPKGDVIIDDGYFTTIKVVDLPDPNNLKKVGNHMFTLIDNTQQPQVIEEPQIELSALERSNTNLLRGLGELVVTQRSYEFQQRVMDTILTQILRKTVTDLPRPV